MSRAFTARPGPVLEGRFARPTNERMKTLARADCRAEIARRLRTLQPDAARRWGRMTAHQMICHLGDACRMATGEKPVQMVPPPRFGRTLLKYVVLCAPVRWPEGVPTTFELDQECAGTRPADFGADLASVERLLESLLEREAVGWPPHPIFGRMSRAQWLRWAYLHTDHHLRQFGA